MLIFVLQWKHKILRGAKTKSSQDERKYIWRARTKVETPSKERKTMTLKPLKDRVVAVKEEAPTKTKSGILLGEAKEKPAYAVVESVGPDVKEVKKGDKIIFKEYSTTDVKVDEKEYIIVKEEDILATL